MTPTKQKTAATKTDTTGWDWEIHDGLIRLREWGTDRLHELRLDGPAELVLGADDDCDIKVIDTARRVSRKHAKLVRSEGTWAIVDLDSKNGTRVDGSVRERATLDAGLEIGIGGVTLVAESARSVALRGFLSRILGWTSERIEAVDLGLRAIRMAATRRAPLVLCGEADLVSTALAIHRIALGSDRPFVAADPRRKDATESVRAVQSYQSGAAALDAARGGSLCVLAARLPRDFDDVRNALLGPAAPAQLIVCATKRPARNAFSSVPIEVPSLASRAPELARIIEEYASDAMRDLNAPRGTFRPVDREWISEHASTTLSDIEKAATRLVALRVNGYNVTRAAVQLGMAHVSLARWIGRRRLPPH